MSLAGGRGTRAQREVDLVAERSDLRHVQGRGPTWVTSDRGPSMRCMEVTSTDLRGESNTRAGFVISTEGVRAPYRVARAGVDEIRVVVSLSGDSLQRAAALQAWKVKGMPSCRHLGWETLDLGSRRNKLVHLLGGEETGTYVFLHEESGSLHLRRHFVDLETLSGAHAAMLEGLARLETHAIAWQFVPRVARIDYAADVVFRTPAHYLHVESAFASMLPPNGRVVRRVWETLYLHAGDTRASKRLARVYDKGRERRVVGGYDLPNHALMRIEVENVYERHRRPELDSLSPLDGGKLFLERLGCVGRGTVVLKGGLVDPLEAMLDAGTITKPQAERMYAFLDLCRMGMAERFYDRNLYLARAREARKLGLEVPNDDRSLASIEDELDVRALVGEIAERV